MNSIASAWSRARLALFALILCLGSFTNSSYSQVRVANYIVSNSSNNFTWDYGNYLGWGVNTTYNIALPFNFTYDGVAWNSGSTLQVSTSGWVRFGGGNSATDYNIQGNSAKPNTINVLSQYLYCASAMYYTTTGSTGSRVFTIGWYYMYHYNYYNGYKMFSLKLNEADNSIEMLYNERGSWMGPYAHGVGLNGGTGGGFSSLTYQNNEYVPSVNVKFRPPKSDAPDIKVSTNQVTYPDLPLGQTSNMCVTVTNNGKAGEAGAPANPLVFSPAQILGFPAEFVVTSSPTTSLNIGQSASYCVQFQPNQPGTRNSTLRIVSNGSSGVQNVSLTGKGLAPISKVDQTFLFRKTRTKLAGSRDESFWVRNTGGAPLTITSAVISGEYPEQYSIVSSPTAPIAPSDSGRFVIRYSPRYEGLKSGILTVTTNGFGPNTHTVNLFGLGIIPRLTVTPGTISGDSVAIGDTAFYVVRLENVGSDTVAVFQDYFASADKDYFYMGLVGSDSLIAPDKFREVIVGFAPQTRGTRQARLRFTTNLPKTFDAAPRDTSEFNVFITAVGVPYGLISVEGPTAIDSSRIGTEVCQPVTIWNNGQSSLTINSASIMGADASDFTLRGITLPTVIPAMGSITGQICATPSARGLRSAQIDVSATSGDRNTSTQLPLMVYGQLVCAQPDATSAFGGEITRVGNSKTAQIMINNCGDVAASYHAVVAGSGYTLVGNATSPVIAPGGMHTYEVSYNASAIALQPGTLTVHNNGGSDIVVDLVGTGGNSQLAALNTSAQNTAVNSNSTFDVTVNNTGNMDWTVGTASITPSTEFSLVSAPSTIAAGQSGTFTFTFAPSDRGNRTANVTFPGSDNSMFNFVINGQGIASNVRPVAMNGYTLGQNYPNPFNPSTSIMFTMAEAGMAKIVISDVTGNVVATVADAFYPMGENEVQFNASNLASGSYFYELFAGNVRLQRAMILDK